MCGIVGVVGQPSNINRKLFNDLLCIGVKRGHHSTGVILANRKETFTLKKATFPWDLIYSEDYWDIHQKGWTTMIGHNRLATKGDINDENAHPFTKGDIHMVHNGTLDSDTKWDSLKEYEVDSEAIAHELAENGIDETWKTLEGAACISWWDDKLKKMFIITNGKRPMFFTSTKDHKAFLFASDDDFLTKTAFNNDVEIERPSRLKVNNLASLSFKKNKIVVSNRDVEPPPVTTYYGISRTWNNNSVSNNYPTQWRSQNTSRGWVHECIKATEYVAGFSDDCCVLCQEELIPDSKDDNVIKMNYDNGIMIDKESIVCHKCIKHAVTLTIPIFGGEEDKEIAKCLSSKS